MKNAPTPQKPLTHHQQVVLMGLASGQSNLEIAEALGVTEHTVKYHCRGIYSRFNVTNRFQLMSLLLRPYLKSRPGGSKAA